MPVSPRHFHLAGADTGYTRNDNKYILKPTLTLSGYCYFTVHYSHIEMQVRWVVLIQNIFTLMAVILCKVQNVGLGTLSCLRERPTGQKYTRVMFLREETSLLLYITFWSEDMGLLSCEVNKNRLVIGNYSKACDWSNSEDEGIIHRFNLSVVLSPHAPCIVTDAPDDHRDPTSAGGKTRRKRSWIFPGTLWCGTGSKAVGYDQLGMFESADRCCREHDHCPHIIPALTVNYGIFNPNFFTVSHCDCDQRFRQCLLDVNDTISSMVGYSFFRILRVPCFELKFQKQCTEMYWWGMCKVTKEAPYAIFKKALSYNTSLTSKYETSDSSKSAVSEGRHVTEIQEISPPRKAQKDEQKCVSKDPPRGDTFFRKTTNGCKKRKQKLPTLAPYVHTTLSSLKTGLSSKTKGPKSLRNSLSSYSTAPPKITTNPYLKATSTTQTTALLSKRPATLKLKNVTATTKTLTGHKKSLEREDTVLPQNKRSPLTTTSPPVRTTKGLVTTKWTPTTFSFRWKSTTTSVPHYDNTTTTFRPFTHYFKSKTQNQVDTPMAGKKTNRMINSWDIALKQNKSLLNKTDYLLCESFKYLDECQYKIPPLKKRFGLRNLDTKPAYHCACTRRLAHQIQSFKQSAVPPSFLVDFVSENCFKLPKRKKSQHGKSCSRGFSKASDLLQALKKEENDIARVRNSGKHRKGRISVRLYKRCLRLRQEMTPII